MRLPFAILWILTFSLTASAQDAATAPPAEPETQIELNLVTLPTTLSLRVRELTMRVRGTSS